MRATAPNARIAATANNIAAMALMARSGVGLAALPIMVGDPDEDLVRLFGPIKNFITPFHIFMHEDFKHTPRIRAFFDFVIDEIPSIRPLFTGEKRRCKPVHRVPAMGRSQAR
jgi:DNA-binding transcriptional LysR family regulator